MSQTWLPEPGSPWFLVFFVCMWAVITGALANLSGWASLATRFRSLSPISGEPFRFASAGMGFRWLPVSYGSCLKFMVNSQGFGMSILFPFRFLSPPLFIPWAQVESVTKRRFLFFRSVVVQVKGHWAQIRIGGRVGESILETYARWPSSRVL